MAAVQSGWSRWYDDAPTHPKFLEVGHKGGWLYVCGQAYASTHATDGRIPKAIVPRLTDVPKPMQVASTLVAAGLWHDRGDHYEQHDYTEMQTTAAEREEKREKKSSAGGRGNHVKWHVERGVVSPDCRWCDPDTGRTDGHTRDREPLAPAIPTRSHRGSPEAEAEAEKRQEEDARAPDPMTLLVATIPTRHRHELDVFPGRQRLADALDAAVTAGWPPGRAVSAVLAGSLDTARSVGAVLIARAETLARQKPPTTTPDTPCPDCNGAGLRWSDDGTTAWPCGHPNVRNTA